MGSLAGRVAIVTGAAEGPKASLGAMFARSLATAGASVVACDRQDCTPVVEEIRRGGGKAMSLNVDISSEASVKELVSNSVKEFGGIDILINNAAVGSNIPPAPLAEMTTDAWDEVMSINVRGTFLCCKHVAPVMASKGYGKIVNLGSTTSRDGLPQRLHYVVAKGAIETMTRALARELGPSGVRVNCLAPGFVMSRAVDQAMKARPGLHQAVLSARSIQKDIDSNDLLKTLVFLCAADSDPISGQYIVVDNGATFT